MSIETTTSIEVTADSTDLTIEDSTDLVSSSSHEPCVQEKDTKVDVVKSEYSIVGDALYATVNGEVPYWLSVLIDNTVDNAISTGLSDYDQLREDVTNAIAQLDVAANTYVEQIIIDQTIDDAITARLNTLDATYQNHFATKTELTVAVSDAETALTQDINDLSVSLNGTIDSRITSVETAFAAADSTLTSSINALTSSYSDLDTDITGTATTLQGLQSFVGVDSSNLPDGTGLNNIVTSHSTAFTNLENGITGPAGDTAYSLSNLEQRSEAYADASSVGVESKFAYDTILNINGQYHRAGFGLSATGVTQPIGADGTLANPFSSRFWIDADEFIISDDIGAANPVFSIDTVSRDVIFNGKVTFNSGGGQQVGTIDEAITASVEQVAVGDKNINITDNLIPTTSLVTDINNAGYQFIGDPIKSSAVGVDTFAEPQVVLDANDEVYSPYVDEMVYAYYYRFGIKGITDLSPIKITTLNSSDAVTYGTLVHQMEPGHSLSSTQWYIIDGIINPTGGNNDFAGAIRLPDGTKVGEIRNYVIPADAVKLLLGWQYNVTISRMKLAKITADTVTGSYATNDYVNTTLDNYVVNYTDLVGKDLLAQQFGYVNYSDLETAYSGGNTVINGGSLNTGLIAAEGITADMVVSSGLITNSAQIGDGLITTAKIGDAQITNAKIGTAAVDTLTIAGNAVTIPNSSYTAGSTNISTSKKTVASITYTSSGAPVHIVCSALFVGDDKSVTLRLLRNGVNVWESLYGLTIPDVPDLVAAGAVGTIATKDTPGVGSVTYEFQASANGTVSVYNRAILALEVKK